MNPAPNLVLVGPMGAGKSSIGKRLASRLGLHFVDLDTQLEAAAGAAIPVIFEIEGEAGFRAREAEMISGILAGHDQVIATGGGAVLAAQTRAQLTERSFVVYLRVGIEQQLQRLARDLSRPLLASGDRRATLQTLAAVREPMYRQVADLVFESDGVSLGAAANKVLALVQAQWRREARA